MRERRHLPPSFLAAAADLVGRRTGLVFCEARRSAFEAGLLSVMRRAGCTDPQTYLGMLARDGGVLDALVAEVTVGETYFFRAPEQFAVVRERIIPDLLARAPRPAALRMWSAGCATGEEAYSLAVLLDELGLRGVAHIIGTDLSRPALAKARRGRYRRWSLRGVPAETADRFFEPEGDELRLTAALRESVEFRYLNLAEDVYPSLSSGIWGMDLILCRNVLIYFDPDTVARVVRRLVRSLAARGWLLLGASDPLITELAPVEAVVTEAGLAYRKRVGDEPRARTWQDGAGPRRTAGRSAMDQEAQPAGPIGAPDLAEDRARASASRVVTADVGPCTPLEELNAASLAYAAGQYGRVVELTGRLVRGAEVDPQARILLVRALANQGELEAAGRACAAGLERHLLSAELLYLHGLLLSEAGRHADAVSALRRALYLDPKLAVVHLALGGELLRVGHAEGARRAFHNALRLLGGTAAEAVVPASDGETAGRLAEIAKSQLELLGEAA